MGRLGLLLVIVGCLAGSLLAVLDPKQIAWGPFGGCLALAAVGVARLAAGLPGRIGGIAALFIGIRLDRIFVGFLAGGFAVFGILLGAEFNVEIADQLAHGAAVFGLIFEALAQGFQVTADFTAQQRLP